MILIADSGSTKTHWCLLTPDNKRYSYFSQGLNPYFHTEEEIINILKKELLPQIETEEGLSVFFYGAGCGSEEKNQIIVNALSHVLKAKNVEVNNDLLAAARALCGREEGIVSIMGTGSNTCYYNGCDIVEKKGGLGYILGDEGSGAFLGKLLVQDFLNTDMPENIRQHFDSTFHLTDSDIINSVYKKNNPNRFLASFSPFIHQNISKPYLYNLVYKSFDLLFEKSICKYANYESIKLNCVGSVANNYKDILMAVAKMRNVSLGKIINSPIDDLVDYHQSLKESK